MCVKTMKARSTIVGDDTNKSPIGDICMKTFLHTSFKLAIASVFALALLPAGAATTTAAPAVTPAEARAIAKDAYIYG